MVLRSLRRAAPRAAAGPDGARVPVVRPRGSAGGAPRHRPEPPGRVPGDRHRLLVQAMSRRAELLLGLTEDRAINRPVAELLVPADAEARAPTAVSRRPSPRRPPGTSAHAFVRPWNTFGVRMRARIAPCGPPRAALRRPRGPTCAPASRGRLSSPPAAGSPGRRRRQRRRQRTEPSSCWPFSSSAMIVRPTATAVPLSVWTCSAGPRAGR